MGRQCSRYWTWHQCKDPTCSSSWCSPSCSAAGMQTLPTCRPTEKNPNRDHHWSFPSSNDVEWFECHPWHLSLCTLCLLLDALLVDKTKRRSSVWSCSACCLALSNGRIAQVSYCFSARDVDHGHWNYTKARQESQCYSFAAVLIGRVNTCKYKFQGCGKKWLAEKMWQTDKLNKSLAKVKT